MKAHPYPYGKKLLSLPILMLLTLSLLSAFKINMIKVSAVEYPAIYVDPPSTVSPDYTVGTLFTVAIKTDYKGTDTDSDYITSYQFTLFYNPNVLHGGVQNTDTWSGDGVKTTFYTTQKPVVPDSEEVHVDEILMTKPADYTIDYPTGKITFTTAPPSGAELKAAYVHNRVVNGDLIVGGSAKFLAGPFDNVAGELSLTVAWYAEEGDVAPGPGTLAYVTFTVVGYGTSDITIGSETKLIGWNWWEEPHDYNIIDASKPPGATEPPYGSDHIQHGYFANAGSIAGKVTDASTGLPISGATVTAVGPETYSNTTKADGTYLLANVPPGYYTINASKTGYYTNSTSATVFTEETTTVNFTLKLIVGWINGTVKDALTGDPIYNATLTADSYSTTTDIDGKYTIPADLLPGTYKVKASKTGYYSNSTFVTVTGGITPVNFMLKPLPPAMGAISGTVTDALTGAPIYNATVSAAGYLTTTNIDGYYDITIAPGTYTVTASATGYESASQTDVTVFAEEPTTVDFALTPLPGVINGTVTDASTSLPIAGATVEAVGPETKSTTTDADGYYVIADVPPGDYAVTASAVGYYSNSTSATVKSEETTTLDFTLKLIVGWIDGKVTDNATIPKPIKGATVTAGDYSTTTDDTGYYNIKVPVGTYNVTASMSGYYDSVKHNVPVSENITTTVNFKLQLIVGWIDGYVNDAKTGSAIFLAEVTVDGVSPFGKSTDINGYYKIEAKPGVYTVNASKTGYCTNSTSVTVTGGITKTVNLALTPLPGAIAGTVTDVSTGEAIAGATVTANGMSVTTNSSGAYTISDIPAGTYTVTASAEGYESSVETNITVVAGETTSVDFELTSAVSAQPLDILLYAGVAAVAIIIIAGIAVYIFKVRKPT